MNKLFIYPNPTKASVSDALPDICDSLIKTGFELYLSKEYKKYFKTFKGVCFTTEKDALENCECVIVVGGDGTILHLADTAASVSKPILGINLGKVGFLSELEINEIDLTKALLNNDFKIDKRMMLRVSLVSENGEIKYKKVLLNEVSVIRAMLARIVDFSVSVNGKNMMSFSADGVIVASPTGSTAYSLSAGGAILEPSCECLIVTPVCPHALNIKSVVLPGSHKVSIKTDSENSGVMLTADGFSPVPLEKGDTIEVTRSDLDLSLIRIKGTGFYETMCNKLSRGRSK